MPLKIKKPFQMQQYLAKKTIPQQIIKNPNYQESKDSF